jgi:hypothetical protein
MTGYNTSYASPLVRTGVQDGYILDTSAAVPVDAYAFHLLGDGDLRSRALLRFRGYGTGYGTLPGGLL